MHILAEITGNITGAFGCLGAFYSLFLASK